jgi:acetyltransferase-like isoleucine patch superfamily enzyme
MNFKHLGRNVTIYPRARIVYPEMISIGDNCIIDDFVFLHGGQGITLGEYVHIAVGALIMGGGVCEIGPFSGVAMGAQILTGSDDYEGVTLLGPAIEPPYRRPIRSFVRIGRQCVIGANSVVLPGVTIGDGVSVGALSLVTHDLPPWWLCYGIPAKPHRKRPREEIEELEAEFLEAQR